MAAADIREIVARLEYRDDAKVVAQLREHAVAVQSRMRHVGRAIAVMSGKGGVGKSMTAVNLALSLARTGAKVGLLDADLNGPCAPRMLGVRGTLEVRAGGAVPPVGPLGIKVASMEFLVAPGAPPRWKGPMDLSPVWLGLLEMNVIRELLADIAWGELDYLIFDLPPGAAADKPPLIAGLVPDLAGAVFVTTPSDVASEVVNRSMTYAKSLGIRILGVVENMSGVRCGHCGEVEPLFDGDAAELARAHEVPLLGRVPFDRDFAKSFDRGAPLLDALHPTIRRYGEIAMRLGELLDVSRAVAGL
jgi:ATP-binding protein involved in chromosome partitioning